MTNVWIRDKTSGIRNTAGNVCTAKPNISVSDPHSISRPDPEGLERAKKEGKKRS
jgi:hypothetical protein